MSDLICITNRTLCQEDFFVRLEKIAQCHPKAIILREKDLPEAEYKIMAEKMLEICEKTGTTAILHSFINVAMELHAKGLHLPISKLVKEDPKVLERFEMIGASCHSLEDVLLAEKYGCNYVTLGHIYDTDCKKGLPGRGISFLQAICKEASIPVYAIGGINKDRIQTVMEAGAAGACIMSGFMNGDISMF